jgi:hypothetical protein
MLANYLGRGSATRGTSLPIPNGIIADTPSIFCTELPTPCMRMLYRYRYITVNRYLGNPLW